jgi:hypothetical protein
MDTYDYDTDPASEKLLSDNRDRYIQQSSNTRCGQVAPLPQSKEMVDRIYHVRPHSWFLRDRSSLEFSVASRPG